MVRLVSTGTTAVNLSDITLRYWFTPDGTSSQVSQCFYASLNCSNVTMKLVQLPAARGATATWYYEIGFTAGAGKLAAGGSLEVQSGFHHSDWKTYNETNDYSWSAAEVSNNYTDSDKFTVYQNGFVVWGTEPTAGP
jgi:hypothetical protein